MPSGAISLDFEGDILVPIDVGIPIIVVSLLVAAEGCNNLLDRSSTVVAVCPGNDE